MTGRSYRADSNPPICGDRSTGQFRNQIVQPVGKGVFTEYPPATGLCHLTSDGVIGAKRGEVVVKLFTGGKTDNLPAYLEAAGKISYLLMHHQT